ncbi:phage tail tape measure protein [Neisseria sp. N95_16]|uniref:Phage tail tape measure protein n=1 Tax=Neisseria brasiliensis TaxID=2666100 RepID=A0A7X2KZ09_9NEIS|nr:MULTISPECIES: phage tail tape measure protein [Neisseria]MRN38612.1 phage tail tape measure protein [Neisseria brasiliensis]PJO10747.1 phage tail tape measure protein [Neisseria sp. N95_16]
MDDLYNLKFSVDGLNESIKKLTEFNKTLAKVGTDQRGLTAYQGSLKETVSSLSQSVDKLAQESSRISDNTSKMMASMVAQAEAADKALTKVTRSAKKEIQDTLKNVNFDQFMNGVRKLKAGAEVTTQELNTLAKTAAKLKAVHLAVKFDLSDETGVSKLHHAVEDIMGSKVATYVSNDAIRQHQRLINLRQQDLELAKLIAQEEKEQAAYLKRNEQLLKQEEMARARIAKARERDVALAFKEAEAKEKALLNELKSAEKLNQSNNRKVASYEKQLSTLQHALRYQKGSAESLDKQLITLRTIEAEYKRIAAMQAGVSKNYAIQEFTKSHGVAAYSENESKRRNELLALGATEYSRRIDDANKKLQQTTKLSQNIHGIWRGIAASTGNLWLSWGNFATMAAGLAVGGSVFQSLKFDRQLGWQMQLVGVAAETSAEEVKRLQDEVLRLGSSGSLYGPIELASSLRVLAQAGMKTQEALAALPTTLKLSLVAEVDTENSALFLAGLKSAFNLTDSQLQTAADQTAKAAALSQTSIEQMMESMKQASSEANKFGLSVSDTSAALALLARVNITGSAAGTAVKNLLTDLAGRTVHSRKALEELGISVYNSSGMLKPFSNIIRELQERFQGMSDQQKQGWMISFLNERGMRAANIILNTSVEEFEKLAANTARAGENMGYTTTQAELLGETSEGMFRGMTSAWQTHFAEVGNSVNDPYKQLLQSMTDLANSENLKELTTALSTGFITAAKAAVGFTSAVATMAPVLQMAGAYMGVVGTASALKWVAAVNAGTASAGLMASALVKLRAVSMALVVGNPVIAAAGALAALVVGVSKAYDALQPKVANIKTEFQKISDVAGSVSNKVLEDFNTIGRGLNIDKMLGIGFDADKFNKYKELQGSIERVSKEYVLAIASSNEEFQNNLTKIKTVSTKELNDITELEKKLAEDSAKEQIEQKVMVLDRTKSILTDQLEKFDQHHSHVNKLSEDSMKVRLAFETELHRITKELMTQRTTLAIEQIRETAAEAIRQQSALEGFFGRVANTFNGNGHFNQSIMRVLNAAKSGDYKGLTEVEKRSAGRLTSEAATGGAINSRSAEAALVASGGKFNLQSLKALHNSLSNSTQNEAWRQQVLANPQRAAIHAKQVVESAEAAIQHLQREVNDTWFSAVKHAKYQEIQKLKQLKTAFNSRLIAANQIGLDQGEEGRARKVATSDPEVVAQGLPGQSSRASGGRSATQSRAERPAPTYNPVNVQNREVAYQKRLVQAQDAELKQLEFRLEQDKLKNGFASQELLIQKHQAETRLAQLKVSQAQEELEKAKLQDEQALLKAQKAMNNSKMSEADRARAAADYKALSGRSSFGASGLRLKSREAIEGGRTKEGTYAAGHLFQRMFGKNLVHFAAFNDGWHMRNRPRSYHNTGLALDFTLKTRQQGEEAVAKIKAMMESLGIAAKDYFVQFERKGEKGATGDHIHFQWQSLAAAARFAALLKSGKVGSEVLNILSGVGGQGIQQSYAAEKALQAQQAEYELQQLQVKQEKELLALELSRFDASTRLTNQRSAEGSHQLEIRRSLGLISEKEYNDEKLKLQVAGMRLELERKLLELKSQGYAENSFEYHQTQQEGLDNIRRTEESDAARRAPAENWQDGVRTSFRRLADEAVNYGKFATDAFETVTGGVTNSLNELALTGKLNFKSMSASILSDLSKIFSRMAAMKLVSAIGGAFMSAGASAGASNPTFDALFAKGGVIGQHGVMKAYAAGGVVNSPTRFIHSGGRGLMGENGPEGILPLSRLPNGDLGVKAIGVGNAGTVVNAPVNVVVTVNSDGSSDSEVNASDFQQLGKTIQNTVIQVLNKELLPGGVIYKSMRGRA